MKMEVTLKGVEPGLLMHSLAMYGDDRAPEGFADFKAWAKADPDAACAYEAEKGAYRDADGNLCIPALNLQACFIEACKRETPPKGLGNPKSNLARCGGAGSAALVGLPSPASATLLNGKGKPLKDYTVDMRHAVVGSARILRGRAHVPEWTAKFVFEADQGFFPMSMDDWRSVWEKAGRMIGLMDWRPAAPKKPGVFGKFVVAGWEEIE